MVNSNKALTILIIATIVISIGGTIISISRVNRLVIQVPRIITGMAGTGSGYVNITIATQASIALVDPSIDFGSCSPNSTTGSNITSNSTTASWGAPGVCTSIPQGPPSNITIRNDGNVDINVTINAGTLAASLIPCSGVCSPFPSAFWFISRNGSSSPGCFNRTGAGTLGSTGLQLDWKNFSAVQAFGACDNLTPTSQFSIFARLDIPENAQTGSEVSTLTFTGTDIS